jgi:thiol-disulfide isomerase/thioredoxin
MLLALAALLTGTSSCADPYGAAEPHRAAEPTTRERAPAPAAAKPAFVDAGDATDVPQRVLAEVERSRTDGRRVVVYVGASWCEPCKRFHDAVERGELDAALANIRFLEFDSDRHGAALDAAGFGGRLIPRFALPGDDGRGSGKAIEGGTKGDDAVAHIMARLGPLLAG